MEKKTELYAPKALMEAAQRVNIREARADIVTGRITNIRKEQERTDCLIQGVKGQDQWRLEQNPMIRGGNGTYLEIGEYLGTKLYFNITLYDPPCFEYNGKKYQVPKRVQIESYEEVRQAMGEKVFGRYAITNKTMDRIVAAFKGEKVKMTLTPMILEEDRLYIWLWVMITMGQRNPVGGLICAFPETEGP